VSVMNTSTIPTLQELASMETVSSKFQNDSKTNEQAHQELLATLLKHTASNIKQVFDNHKRQVQKLPEGRMEALLGFLQRQVGKKIDEGFKLIEDAATSTRKQIIENANKERKKIRDEWIDRRQAILNEHQSFLKACQDGQGLYDPSISCRPLQLCLSPGLSKLV
jgi:hypothetical protein